MKMTLKECKTLKLSILCFVLFLSACSEHGKEVEDYLKSNGFSEIKTGNVNDVLTCGFRSTATKFTARKKDGVFYFGTVCADSDFNNPELFYTPNTFR